MAILDKFGLILEVLYQRRPKKTSENADERAKMRMHERFPAVRQAERSYMEQFALLPILDLSEKCFSCKRSALS